MNKRYLGEKDLKKSTEQTIELYTNRIFDISIWAGVGRPSSLSVVRRFVKNELDK